MRAHAASMLAARTDGQRRRAGSNRRSRGGGGGGGGGGGDCSRPALRCRSHERGRRRHSARTRQTLVSEAARPHARRRQTTRRGAPSLSSRGRSVATPPTPPFNITTDDYQKLRKDFATRCRLAHQHTAALSSNEPSPSSTAPSKAGDLAELMGGTRERGGGRGA